MIVHILILTCSAPAAIIHITHLGQTIVHIFILRTDGKEIADGMSGTDAQLPRSAHRIIQIIVLRTIIAVQVCIVVFSLIVVVGFQIHVSHCFEGIESRCFHGQTQTECRILYRADYETELGINAIARCALQREGIIVVKRTLLLIQFGVERLRIIVHIIHAKGKSQIEAVLQIGRHVEVKSLKRTFRDTRKLVALRCLSVEHTLIRLIQQEGIISRGSQISREIECFPVVAPRTELIGQAGQLMGLRQSFGISVIGHKRVVIVGFLLIVGTEIQELQRRSLNRGIQHKAQLIEREMREVVIRCSLVGLRHHTDGSCNVVLTIQTDTGRIGRNDRHVGTQGAQGATHTYIAGRSVQIGLRSHLLVDISVLSQSPPRHQQQCGRQGSIIFLFHLCFIFSIQQTVV